MVGSKSWLVAGLLLLSSFAFGQRKFKSANVEKGQLVIEVSDGKIVIQPYSEEVFTTTFYPTGQTSMDSSYAIAIKPKVVNVELEDHNHHVHFTSPGLAVEITKSPFNLSYSYKGKDLVSEKGGFFDRDSVIGVNFQLDEGEMLFGGGERAIGMNQRGRRLKLYNQPSYGFGDNTDLMYYCIPTVVSSDQYLLLWDNHRLGYLDMGKTEASTLTLEATGGRTSYAIVAGSGFQEIAENYTQLTGLQPLPPVWALGNYASRFGYHSEKEVRNVSAKFQEDQIPMDGLVLDIFWFGQDIKGHMGTLDWLKDSFPNGPQMVKDLRQEGVKTILISEPFVLTTSKRWQEALDADVLCKNDKGLPYVYEFYFGETGLIDIFKPQARQWLWNIYKEQRNQGVEGWWCDLGEPEVHPKDLFHYNGPAHDVHAVYGHEWARVISEGMAKDFPNERHVVVMRSGYAGTQRYGIVTWSGDVQRDWPGLRSQPSLSLQMGMQGLAYHHSDLGGFAGDKQDPELYTRWLQYGVFQPIFRPHAQEAVPSEPIFWDDTTKARAKAAVELRYKLMPYNYTLAYQNSTKGTPLMRPLIFDEPDNKQLFAHDDAYLWGDAFLVAPVKDSGATNMEVYLPKGSNWINFHTEAQHTGGASIKVPLTLENIPVFVRTGTVVPMLQKVEQTADQYSTAKIEAHIYLDDKGAAKGILFDDNGKAVNSISSGDFELLEFTYKTTAGGAEIMAKSTGKSQLSARAIEFFIHGPRFAPSKAVSGGKELPFEHRMGMGVTHIPANMTGEQLVVKLVK